MRQLLIALLLSLVWLGPAVAAPARVQTGEHADFTRVVVIIPADANWQLGRSDTGYLLRLPGVDGFATDDFFDLIPKDRITAVSQDPATGELRLDLNCVCNADAFLDRPTVLVIDIRDGPAAPGSSFETMLDAQLAALDSATPEDRLELAPILPLFAVPGPEIVGPPTDLPSLVGPPVDQLEPEIDASRAPDLAALENSVVESLGRALSLGLLEADPDRPAPFGDMPEMSNAPAPGMRVSTGVDRAAIPEDPFAPLTQQGDACVPGAYFDVVNWGDDRPFSDQISAARAQLTLEFDRVDEDAVTALARTFVYFGFGREAVQVLALDALMSQERLYLAAMAKIIDGDPVDPVLFAQQVSCQSEVALWAALASPEGALDARLHRQSVLRTFNALPPALQAHLAPRLSERFLAIGDSDAAMQTLDAVNAIPDPPLAADLANAELSRALGDEGAATAALERIADTDARVSPEAMIRLLTDAVRDDRPVRENDLILADALRFENATLPIAADLAVAQARAFLHLRDFSAAQALIDDLDGDLDDARHAALGDEFARRAASDMPDGDFLVYAFGDDARNLPAATENLLARRLLSLGFAAQAMQRLAAAPGGDADEERLYLLTEAAIAVGDLARADATLGDLATDRANALRQHVDDLRITNSIVPREFRRDGADGPLWQRGDWGELTQSGDALLQAASIAALDNDIAAVDQDRPLTSGRALLDQSAAARAVIEDLLERFEGPADF